MIWRVLLLLTLLSAGCSLRPERQNSPAAVPEVQRSARTDKRFLRRMVRHHHDSIELAEDALLHVKAERLHNLAMKILADQQRELVQIQTWRQSWYHQEPYATTPTPVDLQPGIPYDHAWAGAMLREHRASLEIIRHSMNEFEHAELKQFAQTVQARLQDEAAQLEGWLKENVLTAPTR